AYERPHRTRVQERSVSTPLPAVRADHPSERAARLAPGAADARRPRPAPEPDGGAGPEGLPGAEEPEEAAHTAGGPSGRPADGDPRRGSVVRGPGRLRSDDPADAAERARHRRTGEGAARAAVTCGQRPRRLCRVAPTNPAAVRKPIP